jgi:diguanylate cyclase (GGDEF)-like protein/PAS domain S-box-containing protein
LQVKKNTLNANAASPSLLNIQSFDEHLIAQYLLQGSGIGSWAWNVQTGETRFNERWAEIAGYQLQELQPTTIDTWVRLTHPDDLAQSNALLQAHFQGQNPQYECEARMRHKDGHWVRILDRGQVLVWDGEGQPLWMFGTHLDITSRWRLEMQRDEALQRLQRLSVHLPGFLYQFRLHPDGSSQFPYASAGIEAVYGCTPEEALASAEPVFRVLHPDDLNAVSAGIEQSAQTLSVWQQRYRVNHPVKGVIWVEGSATPEREEDGSVTWHGYLREVTSQVQQEQQLHLAAKVFSSSQEGIMITNAQQRIVDVNTAFTRITGYRREEVLGQKPSILSSDRQPPRFYRKMWRTLNDTGTWQGEVWNRRKSGEVYAEILSIDTVKDSAGVVQHYIAIFTDISHIKEHQRELDRIAHYDALTGLPNRRLFDDRLSMELERARRQKEAVAVCFLDLDGFKAVNDTYGHEVGDRLLSVLGERLRLALRAHDSVARMGGDEFVLLLAQLPRDNPRPMASEIIDRVLRAVEQPVTLSDRPIAVSASVGVAVFPEIDLPADQLLRYADRAMYKAKQQGRNRSIFFDAQEDSTGHARQRRLYDVQDGLSNQQFSLYYQPRVDLRSGAVLAVEALVRWQPAPGPLCLPGEFMPGLAGHPQEIALGQWVMDTALAQHARWLAEGLVLPVGINIAPDHLLHPDFAEQFRLALQRHGIERADRVTLEIRQSTRMADHGRMRACLAACASFGVGLALDDFGAGHSSLTHMRQLPVTALHIDKSLVLAMPTDPDQAATVEGIAGLARALGREVVAKGAETEAHLERLRGLPCQAVQGYAVAPPMPVPVLLDWLRSRQRSPTPDQLAS